MVDSPYFRPPDDEEPDAETDVVAEPVRSRRAGKVRRSAPSGPVGEADVWEMVWTTPEVLEINWAAAVLRDFGFEVAIRSEGSTIGTPQRFGDGAPRVHIAGTERELWTPQPGAERGREILEDAYAEARAEIEADLAGADVPPDEDEPWPGYWTLRDDIAREMPYDGRRAREKEFAHRRAMVDPEFAIRRGRRSAVKTGVALVMALAALVLVASLAV